MTMCQALSALPMLIHFILITTLKVELLSCVRLFATPWTVARQAPLSMGFSRQEYWSSCHFLLQGILDPRIEPRFPTLQPDVLPSEPPGKLITTL